jgi:tRNA threonylcarbamoyladenosine biosynthesis protein TsaB
MTPVLLAFDTSTEALAVGLQGPGGCSVWNGEGGAQASARLLPIVQDLLARAGLALRDVQAIAFGRGPGAFTGLRTACAVAQGLAFGIDRPVIPIDSLLIVAEDERACRGFPPMLDVAVAMDARMGELYAARYRWAEGAWTLLQAPGLWDPQAWAASCAAEESGHDMVCVGSGLPLLAPSIALQGRRECQDRAKALLRLAEQAWHRGQAVPPEQALPVYLRDKVALTTAERLDRAAMATMP